MMSGAGAGLALRRACLSPQAIRLAPYKAVYHANRAATGLKLGRYTAVIEDG